MDLSGNVPLAEMLRTEWFGQEKCVRTTIKYELSLRIRDKCDKCDNLGYDYTFFEKKSVLRKKAHYERK